MIEKTVRENIKAIVQAYAKATGRSVTGISKEFYGNAEFLPLFFKGEHSVSVKKLDVMVEDFRARWPADTRWPLCRVVVFKGPAKGRKLSPEASAA